MRRSPFGRVKSARMVYPRGSTGPLTPCRRSAAAMFEIKPGECVNIYEDDCVNLKNNAAVISGNRCSSSGCDSRPAGASAQAFSRGSRSAVGRSR